MSILTTKRADMCYCPGCSHGMVLEHLGRAIDESGLSPNRVCIVSDIGCIGTADRYFTCHTVHGLHGRSITYAEGIKRVQPELSVIVLIGDGGCGIGTAHLIHAARRNADIKVIVCNNFNFGMTGGQHSPTTPLELSTTTTPDGATDYPFDLCQTVAINGASHVARYSAFDAHIAEHFVQAFNTPGFVLIDVWELCTAYFMPANRLDRGSLTKLSDRLGLPFGLLHQRERRIPVGARVVREEAVSSAAQHHSESDVPRLALRERLEICVAGSAGQRVRSAIGVIGEICVAGGLFAAQQDDFPITVRRGFSISNLIVEAEPILYAGVGTPSVLIILSKDGLDRFGNLTQLDSSCLCVSSQDLVLSDTPALVRTFDLIPIEKRVGRSSVALAALSYAIVKAQFVDGGALRSAAAAAIAGPYRQANLSAISFGIEWAAGDGDSFDSMKKGSQTCFVKA